MELRIISPQENGFIQEIQWNNEELKTAIAVLSLFRSARSFFPSLMVSSVNARPL